VTIVYICHVTQSQIYSFNDLTLALLTTLTLALALTLVLIMPWDAVQVGQVALCLGKLDMLDKLDK
jgi:hypothetical protein